MTRPIYYRSELTRADLTQADLTQGRVDPHSFSLAPCPRALTRILKTGVPEPSLPKSGSPTIQKNLASLKNSSPSTKNGSSELQIVS